MGSPICPAMANLCMKVFKEELLLTALILEMILRYEPTHFTDFDTFTIQGTGSTASESEGGRCLDELTIEVSQIENLNGS